MFSSSSYASRSSSRIMDEHKGNYPFISSVRLKSVVMYYVLCQLIDIIRNTLLHNKSIIMYYVFNCVT